MEGESRSIGGRRLDDDGGEVGQVEGGSMVVDEARPLFGYCIASFFR